MISSDVAIGIDELKFTGDVAVSRVLDHGGLAPVALSTIFG
jgi:hypothetical protein